MQVKRMKGISGLVHSYMNNQAASVFVPGETHIPLSRPNYGAEEVVEALDSMLSTWVTMGEKVKTFERMFAEYIGVKHAVMVNSGSSANLLILAALSKSYFRPGFEIITPAVTWATTVYPIVQLGMVPALVDVGEDYNIDLEAVEQAIIPNRTLGILPVHLMGNPCNMDGLRDIAYCHDLWLMEDACEAHGAEWHGKKVGSFDDVGFFSFFFSHHMSTIEGGMVVTGNDEIAELCRSMRAFGWTRDMLTWKYGEDPEEQYPDIDPRFLFLNPGYNLRPTEIQGAFGIHQIARLEPAIAARRATADYWTKELGEYEDYLVLPTERLGTRHVWFGYPVTVKPDAPFSRDDLVRFLESKGLETRPVGTGNFAAQPVMKSLPHRISGTLENAEMIDRQSFFWGCHQGLTEEEKEAVVGYFKEFFRGQKCLN